MYRRALSILQDLRGRGILDADELNEMEPIAGKTAECDRVLGK
jgi:hypothetical protein